MTTEKQLTLPGDGAADFRSGSVFFVGTATVILRYAGFTVLTDPNFLHRGDRVRLGYGLRATRRTEPALGIDDLPPLDLVLLSHLHEDHFDRLVERRLRRDFPIVTTPHAAAALSGKGFSATHALTTWGTLPVTKGGARLRITAMPGRHGPGPLSFALPPVMGSMLEFETGAGAPPLRLYITGDTLIHDELREIPRRYPAIDLALLHLGGTRVFGITLTMDAGQGVEMLRITTPRTAIPIHYNDYTVFKSPLEDFIRAVADAGLEGQVRYLRHGETYTFERPAGSQPLSGR